MTAYNVVRFRVKPGREEDFLEAHRNADRDMRGMRRFSVVKTTDRSYFVVGEWESFDDIVAARPRMIAILDSFRDMLEDLGGGMGVTDPVSGEAVVELTRKVGGAKPKLRPRAKAPKRAAATPARKPRGTAARKPSKKRSTLRSTKRRGRR
jgi:hypothetical protein